MMISSTFTAPSSAQQPAFNCKYATGLDEVAICNSSALARLDRQLQGLFNTLMTTIDSSDQVLLRDTERRWLIKRGACGSDTACIAGQYQARIVQLAALLSGPSSIPAPTRPTQPPTSPTLPPSGKKDACDAFPTLCQ
jgi:uncharacterized protein